MNAPTPFLECSFPGQNVAAVVELLAVAAPLTCQTLLGRLPINTDTYHTKWNVGEIFTILPPFPTQPPESLTSEVQPGNVVVFHYAGSYRAATAHLRAAELGDYTELGFFYRPMVRADGPAGPVQGTRIGRIVDGLAALAEAARTMRQTGFVAMLIRQHG